MEVIAGDPSWLDHVQAWSTLVAALAAGLALFGVYFVWQNGRRQARVEAGPYIRVDIFPADGRLGDFKAQDPYYETASSLVDLAAGQAEGSTSTFAACFRNYQPHALGTALRVEAFFLLEIRGEASNAAEYRYSFVTIPYIEHRKPVKLQLFRIPGTWSATVWLAYLAFNDFYDRSHEHSLGVNENALHGRLICEYDGSAFRSIPEGLPARRWYTRYEEQGNEEINEKDVR